MRNLSTSPLFAMLSTYGCEELYSLKNGYRQDCLDRRVHPSYLFPVPVETVPFSLQPSTLYGIVSLVCLANYSLFRLFLLVQCGGFRKVRAMFFMPIVLNRRRKSFGGR